jgi:hypothetical protein
MELDSTSKLLIESYITAESDTTQYGNHWSLAMRLYYTQVDITYKDIQLVHALKFGKLLPVNPPSSPFTCLHDWMVHMFVVQYLSYELYLQWGIFSK